MAAASSCFTETGTHSANCGENGRSTVQFLGQSSTCPMCRKTVEGPQLQSVQLLTRPLFSTTGAFWFRQYRKRSGSAASAVLVVVDVAVTMQRQVPALPGGVQSSSSTKSWIVWISMCIYYIFGLRPFGRRVPALSVIFWEPSSTHTCECSKVRGWRGRREFYSQVTWHTLANKIVGSCGYTQCPPLTCV